MEGSQEVCCLCEEPMSEAEKRSLGERAIQSLLEASVRRQDGRRAHLESRKCLGVHRACQAAYLKDAGAAQQKPAAAAGGRAQSRRAAKSAAVERIKSDPAHSERARGLCLELYDFDFTTRCFVCGLEAVESRHRKTVMHVKSDAVRTDILELIENQPSNNKYVEAVYKRLKPVEDLCKLFGRYHSDCLGRLYRYQNFVPRRTPKQAESPKGKAEERDEGKKENESDGVGEIKRSRLM